MYLGRKITRAKWLDEVQTKPDIIPADALVDLRTQSNALSVWECEDASVDSMSTVVLALATSSNDRIERMDCVVVSKAQVGELDILVARVPGETKVADLVQSHRDLEHLNFAKVGGLSVLVQNSIVEKRFRRFSKIEVKKLIVGAIEAGRLEKSDLPDKIRSEVDRLPPATK